MRPDNFVQTSDYLSISEENKTNFSIHFPSIVISGSVDPHIDTQYYNIDIPNGSIMRIYSKESGGDWHLGASYQTLLPYPNATANRLILVSQSEPNRIKIENVVYYFGYKTDYVTIPEITLDFRISFFMPPNIQ